MGYELEGDDPGIIERTEVPYIFEDWTYVVDIEESLIEWTGRNPNTKHYGTIKLSGGEINVKDGQIDGHFEIDMKSIRNVNLEGNPLQSVLTDHLLSDDFFFVKAFPKATFTIKSAEPIKDATQSEPNFRINGVLDLRGIQKDIRFLANAGGEQGGKVMIESHFDIDRTKWGVIYGSARFFERLGMHLVFDLISIQLHIVVG
jgi:polyisoprenoid-binding protein YceI